MAQINPTNLLIGGQLLCCTVFENTAFEEEIGSVCDVQRFLHIVVGDEDTDVLGTQLFHNALDVFHRDGVHAGKWLVEEDELWVRR